MAADPWVRYMRRGEWERAWALGDTAMRELAGCDFRHVPRHLQYVWTGAPVEGRRVLVRCYHGLGDTLQFIRYIPALARVARGVVVWAQAALLPMLGQVPGIDVLLPLHDGTPDAEYEVDVELMELPRVLRLRPTELPTAVPYLRAEPLALTGSGSDPRPRIGLVWQGGDWNPERSMAFGAIAPLAAIPGIRPLIVQPLAAEAGWDGRTGEYPGEFDIPAFARLLASLDLLVTIDSMPAHLAGAMGIPTWLLLHHDPDWRWMEGREDSPWYPDMRLFWQQEPGDWDSVVARVAGALEAQRDSIQATSRPSRPRW